MKRIATFSTLLIFFFFSFTFAPSKLDLPTAKPEEVGISKSRLATLDARMHEYVDKGQLAGVQTAIMRKGKIAHFNTYGYADIDSKKSLRMIACGAFIP